MSRLVLDTNCLIQIVSPRSKFHSLWDSFVRGENTLCVSPFYNIILIEADKDDNKFVDYAIAAHAKEYKDSTCNLKLLNGEQRGEHLPKVFTFSASG